MLFNKNDKIANEKIIYQTKPNMLLGCKKAIFGVILLIVVLSVASPIIAFIGQMQVYLISYVKLSLTRYTAIALFVVILFIIMYIIWQLINWYYMEYILTDSRIIIKSGVLYTRKNYMPYGTIQDVSTSQSIIAKILNVGTVSVYSAYDNNQMNLVNISNVSEVEDIIFSKISNQNPINRQQNEYFEHSKDHYSKRMPYLEDESYYEPQDYYKKEPAGDYEYYPKELNFMEDKRHDYEYESYLERDIEDDMNNRSQNGSYYNENVDDYSYGDDDYYKENDAELYYNDADTQDSKFEQENIDAQTIDSKETIIKRHFDKFKK